METVQHEDGAAKDVDGAQDGGVMAWRNAANPGVAASRMILFIPMGFILGGATSPLMEQSLWIRYFAHFFPLTWEYEFTRDITSRGAGFWDIAPEFGGFLIYFACLILVFCLVFYGTRPRTSSNTAKNTRRT